MAIHRRGADTPGLAAPALVRHFVVGLAPLEGRCSICRWRDGSEQQTPDPANARGAVETRTSALDGRWFAVLRAHLTLRGCRLSRTNCENGSVRFHIDHLSMVRELSSNIAAVRAFAKQLGVRNA